MGTRLQMIYWLTANGELTDEEIAKHLKVKIRPLEKCKERPYFNRRVEEMRAVLEQFRSRLSKTAHRHPITLLELLLAGNRFIMLAGRW